MNPTRSTSPLPCPRCGQPIGRPFAGSALCARCAGERILSAALVNESTASAAPLADPEFSGPQRIGPYIIISELGRGGMGTVYLAQHAQLGRIVALKAIPCSGAASSDLQIRFLREARTIARLRHPHIVVVHDAGQADAHAYFAMDYLDGGDLALRLREKRQLEPHAAALLVQRVAAAIAYSHGEGVLHRDLKPSNILLEGDEPRVADFGLAAQLEVGGDLTRTMVVLGTPHYTAPEALHGAASRGVPADIYSLGVILYELLAGRTPFAGASPGELTKLVATMEPPALRLLAPQVQRDLETICRCALAIEPTQRYPTAAALAEDLQRFLDGKPIVARPVSTVGHLWRWARRRPQLAAVWVLSFLLAVGSTAAAVGINRARLQTAAEASRAEIALGEARKSELLARARLRDAKFAEARALRGTSEPGRRSAALAALSEASVIGRSADVRDEAIAALLLSEFVAVRRWTLNPDAPVIATIDPSGRFAALEDMASRGARRRPLSLRRWGEPTAFARLDVADTSLAGPARFSPDGSYLAARYHDDSLHIWRVVDAAPILTLRGRTLVAPGREDKYLNDDVDFTTDGKSLCIGLAGGGLGWCRLPDGTETARSDWRVRFTTVRCSPDGRRVAACSTALEDNDHEVFVFAEPGAPPEHVFRLTSVALSMAWSQDGRLLAVTQNDNTVTAFDVHTGRIMHAFLSAVREPRGVQFLGGSAFIAIFGAGSAMHVFNLALARDECEFTSTGPSDLSNDVSGGAFYMTSLEGEVTRWDVREPTGFRTSTLPIAVGYDVSGDAGAIDFSDDGRWVATGHGRFAAIREVESGAFAGELDGGPSEATQFSSVMFNREGTALLRCSTLLGLQRHACRIDATGRLATGPGEPLDTEPGFILTAHTVDRRTAVLINRETGAVKVLDLGGATARLISRWSKPGVYHGSLNSDGSQVLLNCSGLGPDAAKMKLSVHRVTDGSVSGEPSGSVSCDTAWSTDGHTALTSSGQAESILWNADTWTRRATLSANLGGNATTFALSPDGTYAVVCRESRVYLVSTQDGTVLTTLTVPNAPGLATAVRFLPDGHRFAVLWPDGRLDIFAPLALAAALVEHKIR